MGNATRYHTKGELQEAKRRQGAWARNGQDKRLTAMDKEAKRMPPKIDESGKVMTKPGAIFNAVKQAQANPLGPRTFGHSFGKSQSISDVLKTVVPQVGPVVAASKPEAPPTELVEPTKPKQAKPRSTKIKITILQYSQPFLKLDNKPKNFIPSRWAYQRFALEDALLAAGKPPAPPEPPKEPDSEPVRPALKLVPMVLDNAFKVSQPVPAWEMVQDDVLKREQVYCCLDADVPRVELKAAA